MSAKRTRRRFTAEQKAGFLRRHHVGKEPVSKICEEEKIQPSLFYLWQRQAFENLEQSFEPATAGAEVRRLEGEKARLEAKLAKKDEIIAWVSEEHVKLKKALGEP